MIDRVVDFDHRIERSTTDIFDFFTLMGSNNKILQQKSSSFWFLYFLNNNKEKKSKTKQQIKPKSKLCLTLSQSCVLVRVWCLVW